LGFNHKYAGFIKTLEIAKTFGTSETFFYPFFSCSAFFSEAGLNLASSNFIT